MNQLIKILVLSTSLFFYQFEAQYVEKRETFSGTELNFTMDERISNALEKLEENCERTVSHSTTETPRVSVPSRELSTAEICRRNPKIMGYKIQVDIVKSNEEANKISIDFRSNFRNLKVEKDASVRPNYKILAGSYFSKQSAQDDFRNVKRLYPNANIVPYAVFCVDAK